MLYRANRNLSNGLHAGDIFPAERLKPDALEILEEKGTVSRVHAPPTIILCGWEQRDEILAEAGIYDLEQLIEAVEVDGVTPEQLQQWQCEALYLLVSDPHAGECLECGKHK